MVVTAADRAKLLDQIDTTVASVKSQQVAQQTTTADDDGTKDTKADPASTATPPATTTKTDDVKSVEKVELTPEQIAARAKDDTLAELEKYKKELEDGSTPRPNELAVIEGFKNDINNGNVDAVEKANTYLDEVAWDRTKKMATDGADDLVNYAFKGADVETQQIGENTGIFVKGALGKAWDTTKDTWNYMRTEHPMITRMGGGLIGALVAMQVLNPMLDKTIGRIPFIGGLLKMLVGLVAFAGITLGGMGLMSGYTQGSGKNLSTDAATGTNTGTGHNNGSMTSVPTAPTTIQAAQTNTNGRHCPSNDNKNNGHVPTIITAANNNRSLEVIDRNGEACMIKPGQGKGLNPDSPGLAA